MLSYQTALKLKEAGFPQKHGDSIPIKNGEEAAYIPTLEELIKACGERFGGLVRHIDNTFSCMEFLGTAKGRLIIEHASDPSEAVANLYLELYKK